ncbi:hypothetical protein [Flaviaesturariibacter aridisoli]|uniref:Uncharacterized protein n=1 Tax=Flaviaesturariibacter aridisoli TaxID=2545761 RepID=A0A4R4DQW7_9BACT|nr:hypothetical protein [Flaviaesturariibacter aridisoli]TCZ64588.1 hypothetical protein E0486_18125 [Flaviaesturariibacter aridisoli]
MRRIILVTSLCVLIGLVAYVLTTFSRALIEGDQDLHSIDGELKWEQRKLDSTDFNYLTSFTLKQITRKYAFASKVRNDILDYQFTNGGELLVFKIDSSQKFSLSKDLLLREGSPEQTTQVSYHVEELPNGSLRIKGHGPEYGTVLVFEWKGNALTYLKKADNLIACSTTLSRFSLSYGKRGPTDILYKQEANIPWPRQQVQFLFLKKECLYLFQYIKQRGAEDETSILDLVRWQLSQ